MASFTPTSDETLADRQRYVGSGLTDVACLDCLARVAVRKNSEHMTSIQWTAEAEASCPDLTRRIPEGPRRSIQGGCPRMAASIEAAVIDGSLPVGLGVD